MTHNFAKLAFTDSVKATQEHYGTRSRNEQLASLAGPNDALGPDEAAFIAERDSLYLATVSETGWPYVQHRGGPKGFVKVIDPRTLAFGDFRGNLQYVSVGNAARNDRVALILMDYARRLRLKVLGRMRAFDIADAPPELVFDVELPDYQARVERVVAITVEAFDWNCPQHITPRFTETEIQEAIQPLHARIAKLEAEVKNLRGTPAER